MNNTKKCLKSIDTQKISQITGYDPDDPVLEASSLWNRRHQVEWSTTKAKNPWPHPRCSSGRCCALAGFKFRGKLPHCRCTDPPGPTQTPPPFAVFVNNKPDIFMVVERCRVNLAAPLSGRSWNWVLWFLFTWAPRYLSTFASTDLRRGKIPKVSLPAPTCVWRESMSIASGGHPGSWLFVLPSGWLSPESSCGWSEWETKCLVFHFISFG